MKAFGVKEKFSIEYELFQNPDRECNMTESSWGTMRIWVDGKNIFAFSKEGESFEYEWYLYYLVQHCINNDELNRQWNSGISPPKRMSRKIIL